MCCSRILGTRMRLEETPNSSEGIRRSDACDHHALTGIQDRSTFVLRESQFRQHGLRVLAVCRRWSFDARAVFAHKEACIHDRYIAAMRKPGDIELELDLPFIERG